MADTDLYNLELLSLVNRITQELNNHIGLNDKTLAEFIISLHDDSRSLADFKAKLTECEAGFPDAFVENLDRVILSLHPKHKKKAVPKADSAGKGGQLDEQDKQRRLFPGLALTDQEWQPTPAKDAIAQEVDDLMAQFEGGAKKQRTRQADGGRSPKRQRRDSPPPPRRRSVSPLSRGRGYEDRRDNRHDRYKERGRPTLDERPVLYKIYDGRVHSMKEFGAFVQLEGLAGRFEGKHLTSLHTSSVAHIRLRLGARVEHPGRRTRELSFGFAQPQSTGQGQGYECRRVSHRALYERCRSSDGQRPYTPPSHQVRSRIS
jgi:ATP-dependent RNA helicase DHX8/PRP22